jgi:predicted PurR-regulated permease PerM
MPDATAPAPPPQTEIPPAGTPSLTGLLNLIVGAVVLVALYVGREVFLPIVLAVLLAFVLAPIVDALRRLRLGRVPAVVLAVVATLGIVLTLTGVIGLQLAGLVSDLPRYEATVRSKVASLRDGGFGRIPDLLKNVGRQIEEATKETPGTSAPPSQPESRPMPVEVHQPDPSPLDLVRTVLGPLLHPLATVGIVFVALIFILLQREDLRDRMIRLFGASDLHRTTVAMDDAARRLSRYFLIQLGLNASFGVIIALGLWAIGVPSPLLWGIFAALMRFVPYIGSFIAGALPVALAAAVDPTGWSMALMTLALFVVTEPLWGHVIEPVVYGQNTGLSPFAVVLSAIVWTWLWGPVGLIIATPLTLCLVVLGRHVERLEFFDVLLGDRPALTPAENLYQRMLAGDPDEALESAELLLKERSLTSYYDEVALGGLQLAANDAGRGVLTGVQLERVKEAIQALVNDLSPHDDVEPTPRDEKVDPVDPPDTHKPAIGTPAVTEGELPGQAVPDEWRRPGAVMCLAGRGPLDEAASTMMAQLLGKHGLGTRVVPHEAVSRSRIINLDVKDVQMVCISYLEISGTPAHLRYLLRRLRQRVPGAPVLVGLWPADEAILKDEKLRAVVGADYYVASLREAVVCCLKAATETAPAPDRSSDRVAGPRPAQERAGERAPLPA